jgi:hypothetical protein
VSPSRRPSALDLRQLAARLGGFEIWRRGFRRWLPALCALLVGVGLFALYQSRFSGRVEVSARALERGRLELARLRADHRRLEGELALVRTNREHLDEFYHRRLATESERLTRVIAEVKELARRSGLEPQAISYPEQAIAGAGLSKRSFVFAVAGSYADLRKLVNLFELSDSFLTLEQVSLGGGADRGNQLQINLSLSTLFTTPEVDVVPAAAPSPPGPAASNRPAAVAAAAPPPPAASRLEVDE